MDWLVMERHDLINTDGYEPVYHRLLTPMCPAHHATYSTAAPHRNLGNDVNHQPAARARAIHETCILALGGVAG